MKDYPQLMGPNLQLRAPEPADIELLYTWENDPSIWKVSNTLVPYSKFQLEEFVMQSRNDIYTTKQLRLMVDLKLGTGRVECIGSIDLFDFEPVHRRAGIGIMIDGTHRGQGYASEALAILIRYAFGILNLHQLFAGITPNNPISIALFEGHGFHRCGTRKDWFRDGDHWQDEWMYQLIG